jgi:protein TonB
VTRQRLDHGWESCNRLPRALLWSLLGHAMLLGMLPLWARPGVPTGETAPVLQARLAASDAQAALAASTAPVRTAGTFVAQEAQRPAKPPRPILEPMRTSVMQASAADLAIAPVAAPSSPAVPMTSVISGEHQSERTVKPGRDSVASAAAAAAPLAAEGDVVDADALRSYRMSLALQARRFKRYPEQAQAGGWSGVAEVRLAIAQGGRPVGAEVSKTSGYAALDRAALAMIDAAAQVAPVPSGLQDRRFAVILPVVFNLDE